MFYSSCTTRIYQDLPDLLKTVNTWDYTGQYLSETPEAGSRTPLWPEHRGSDTIVRFKHKGLVLVQTIPIE